MNEMIQQVTDAVKAEIGRQLGARPLHGSESNWHATGDMGTLDLELVARAAITAMREPTNDVLIMLSFGSDAGLSDWQDAIDEALKDG